MPVVLSHTVNPDSLQAEDFSVVRQSGATSTPMCVTLRPAGDMDENRTVLLIINSVMPMMIRPLKW